jgi:hypothetical protein
MVGACSALTLLLEWPWLLVGTRTGLSGAALSLHVTMRKGWDPLLVLPAPLPRKLLRSFGPNCLLPPEPMSTLFEPPLKVVPLLLTQHYNQTDFSSLHSPWEVASSTWLIDSSLIQALCWLSIDNQYSARVLISHFPFFLLSVCMWSQGELS